MTTQSLSGQDWEVLTFPVGPYGCNCSILWHTTSRDALVIDPGGDFPKIYREIESRQLVVRQILHTHAHFDHWGASRELHTVTKAPLALHPGDDPLWNNWAEQARRFGQPLQDPGPYHHALQDTEEFRLGSHALQCLHTPGHTPGSFSFVIEDLAFTGDTLFHGSVGRTDLWGGDFSLISRSIKNRLYTLDSSTRVITGHGPMTEIGYEKKYNSFVTG